MSQDGHSSETPLDESTNGTLDDNGGGSDAAPGSPQNPMISSPPNDNSPGTELRRRTEALERILMGSDSNLSTQATVGRRVRVGTRQSHGPYYRSLLNRSILARRDADRAILIPFRTRNSVSALNLSENSTRALSDFLSSNLNDDGSTTRPDGNSTSRPRLNVSSIFMQLTYSSAEPSNIHLLKNPEGHKRRLDLHAANTMAILKQYLPTKSHKLYQYRCGMRTKRTDAFSFQDILDKPLDALDPSQNVCNTKILVLINDDTSGKWSSSFTSYLMNSLARKRLSPTCLTFQSEEYLNTLIEQLSDDLHVFPKNSNAGDPKFQLQAKRYLVMSTLAKIFEYWKVPLLVLDSCVMKLIDLEQVTRFCTRFEVKVINMDVSVTLGGNKQKRTEAKRIRRQIHKTLFQNNMKHIKTELKSLVKVMKTYEPQESPTDTISPTLLSDDCKRIVFSLQERMNASVLNHTQNISNNESDSLPQLTLLEDGILADIEATEAFVCNDEAFIGTESKDGFKRNALTTNDSMSEDESSEKSTNRCVFAANAVTGQERISDLLFHELNQRWRINGPLRYQPKTPESGPYCSQLDEAEKQLLISVLQEVNSFETLKDIRNELKDSKKDLEGRLYGHNPDFSNLIASAEEFLHGKASCLEPSQDEIQFYKMPVSLVFSDAEVKFLKSKPPQHIVGQFDNPSQIIKMAMEESTKLFVDAVIGTACGCKKLAPPRRTKTKVIIVVEDNNEALELLTVALWFYDKIPVATFQPKYYYNTSDFLLSLDACRFYYSVYSTRLNKKEEERIFERWLGVGINGLLRSQQNKIIVIDFPRPGMNLQNSKTILLNRLKMEDKLNHIKSFFITRASRKEDNLSTVETIMDEVQKVLEPREKLLFRKSRRTYMDLKLYKQIEQKSRQDLKNLRDWGLPEPDSIEHDMWEKFRSSDLVINPVEAVPTEDKVATINSGSTLNAVSSKESCFADISDTDVGLSDESAQGKNLPTEDDRYLSECEEMDSTTTVDEPDQRLATSLISEPAVNDTMEQLLLDTSVELNMSDEDHVLQSESNPVMQESNPVVTAISTDDLVEQDLNSIAAEPIELSTGETGHRGLDIPNSDTCKTIPLNEDLEVGGDGKLEVGGGESATLEKFEFTLDPHSEGCKTIELDVNFEDGRDDNESPELKHHSLIDCDDSPGFTKLEFTLPPTKSTDASDVDRLKSKNSSGSLKEIASGKKDIPGFCLAFITKFGKSLSKALPKKSRRQFPDKLQSSTYNVNSKLGCQSEGGDLLEKTPPFMEGPEIPCEKKADVENMVPSSLETKSIGKNKSQTKVPKRKWFRGLFTRVKKTENV